MADRQAHRVDSLRALRAFAQVARLGSVSRAAEALGLSQPAVTLQLQSLARQHGVELLERSGRRLIPTQAGEALLGLARPLVDGIDGLEQALHDRLRGLEPTALAVAAGSVALARLLPPALAAGGGVAPSIRHSGGTEALALLRDGTVAMAVGSWLDVPGDIELLPLLQAPARLLVPDAHPLASGEPPGIDALARHALVLPRGRQGTRQLVELPFGRAGLPPPAVVEVGDWHAVSRLVALGQGIGISNALAIEGAGLAGLVARPLPAAFPPRPYAVALRRGRTPSAEGRAFLDALRDTADRLAAGFNPEDPSGPG